MASALHPALAAMKKEGASGRQKLNQYTRYGAVLLCIIQGYAVAHNAVAQQIAVDTSWLFYVSTIINVTGGTMFLLWLGEQITSRGIGNGVSLIIMAGIVAQFPSFASNMFEGGRTGAISAVVIIGFVVMVVSLILLIAFIERAQRRLTIQYPKRATERGMMQAERSYLPLKINTAGVIPPIFASSLLLLPLTVTQLVGSSIDTSSTTYSVLQTLNQYLAHGQPIYMTLYAIGIVFFCFFYTAVVFNPEETADNLKKNGGSIPGIRPGKRTADYLEYVLTRITVVGAIYLTIVCVLPEYMIAQTGVPLFLGGTSLLIVVNVTVDTISQIQSHLLALQYGDLIKKAKLKGRMR
jgi:preprotein translocase subunit SecY